MSDFYTPPDDIPALSRAKALQLNELKDSVVAGFDAVESLLDGIAEDIASIDENAASAAQSAADAEAYADALTTTSDSSVQIGTGSKTFTVEANLKFAYGQFVSIISGADPTNFMHGNVTSYSGTTLVVNVTDRNGSGTFADWSISISGSQGPQGLDGFATLLYSVSASGASAVVFDDQIDNQYSRYLIVCSKISGASDLTMLVGTGSTPTYQTSNYAYTNRSQNTGSSSLTITNSTSAANIPLGSVGSTGCKLDIEINYPGVATIRQFNTKMTDSQATTITHTESFCTWHSSTIVTAIKIVSSGTITGTFKLYGIE